MSSILDMAQQDDDSQESTLRATAPAFVPSSQRAPTTTWDADALAHSDAHDSPTLASFEYAEAPTHGYFEGYSSDEGWMPTFAMPGAQLDMHQAGMYSAQYYPQAQPEWDHAVSWQTAQHLEVEDHLRSNLYQVPQKPMGNTYSRARAQRPWVR